MATSKTEQSALQDFLLTIRDDVYAWCDFLKFTPTFQQRQLFDALNAGETHIAIRSGQGPGKTTATAVTAMWWLLIHPMSRGIITAPTMRQCKDIWLAEAREVARRANQPFMATLLKFSLSGFGIFGNLKTDWGAKPVTAVDNTSMQGQHRTGGLLILCDEASGIKRGIMETLEGTLTTGQEEEGVDNILWLMVGNPNTRNCAFFDCFNSQAGDPWLPLHWNAEETPESPWFSHRRNIQVAKKHGRDSNMYKIRVLGEFPDKDIQALIDIKDLMFCTTDEARPAAMKTAVDAKGTYKKQIGIDLARYGGDENVIAWFSGNIMLGMEAYQNTDPNAAVDRAVLLQKELGWSDEECTYVVDTSGMGEMAAAKLGSHRRMGKNVHEFYSQNTAHDSDEYANKVSEAWYLFSRKVAEHEIFLKRDDKLFAQLSNRNYTVDKEGRIKIETKDEYKKRNKDAIDGEVGLSPDRADAVIMAYYDHAEASSRVAFA